MRMAGVALGVAALLLGITLWQANEDRADRGGRQVPAAVIDQPAAFTTDIRSAPYRGDVWTTVLMAKIGGARPASPPGVPRWPRTGESWVSPAVMRAMREDPATRARVSGKIAGVIGERGLQSPDQYFVYSSVRHLNGSKAQGWGGPASTNDRPTVPSGGLVGLLALLVGLPALVLLATVIRLSSELRLREAAALNLLGAPRSDLATASAVETAWCAAAGAAAGSIGTALLAITAHSTTLLGVSWFAPTSGVRLGTAVGVSIFVVGGLSAASYRRTHRQLGAGPLSARSGQRRRSAWHALPLVIGLAALCGAVLPSLAGGRTASSSTLYWTMLIAGPLCILGLAIGLPVALRSVSALGARLEGGPRWFVAIRRMQHDSEQLGRSAAAMVAACFAAILVCGVVSDLSALSPKLAGGDDYTVELATVPADHVRAVAAVAVRHSYLEYDESGGALTIGTCDQLRWVLRRTSRTAAVSWSRQCHPDRTFAIADASTPSTDTRTVAITDLDSTPLAGTVTTTTQRQLVPGSPPENAYLHSFPGPNTSDIDRYVDSVSRAAGSMPQIEDTSVGVYAPLIPALRRLTLALTLIGLLIASALAIMTSIDNRERVRAQGAALHVVGADRRFAADVLAISTGLAFTLATALALVAGWLTATAYDLNGERARGPGGLGVAVTCAAMALSALMAWATGAIARRTVSAGPPRYE